MRLTFLGTSAADAFPEAFCSCDNCVRARALGGPSLRRRSAALVDDDLLIDLGPDIHTACHAFGLSLAQVRDCIQTHPHSDHLDAAHLLSRSAEYGTRGTPLMRFHASAQTLQRLAWAVARDFEPGSILDPENAQRLNVRFNTVEPYVPISAGRYRVTGFPANHDPAMGSLLYAVEADGRALFYGTDTATLSEDVWQGFQRLGLVFDAVVLDHTYGPDQIADGHLGATEVAEYVVRMRAEGLLRPGGRVFATHIAHEGNPPHPELSAWAAAHGYEAAYDGLVVEM